jgi:hypothetical protein
MDPWRIVFGALMETENVEPLAAMLARDVPIPRWIRGELAELLDPGRGYGTPQADRLLFKRTDATRGKIKTLKKSLKVGMAVVDALEKGDSYADATGKAAGKKDTCQRYEKGTYALARSLPRHLRARARKGD